MILDLCIDDFYQCKESIKVYKGISPTLLSERNGLKVIEMNEVRILGQMDNSIDHTFESANRVYDKLGLCPTIPTCASGGSQPKVIDEFPVICASRGRNPENPNNREKGIELEQRIEVNKEGISNTLTTVQKDNLVLDETIQIRQATKQGYIEMQNGGVADLSYPTSKLRRGRVQGGGNICPTLTTGCNAVHKIDKIGNVSTQNSQGRSVFNPSGLAPTLCAGVHGYAMGNIAIKYRIRKLTPKECWRLMSFSDDDFEKARKVNSNTQLYKEAGNSIVVSCLTAIFSQLNIQGIKPWNERNDDEKKQLING